MVFSILTFLIFYVMKRNFEKQKKMLKNFMNQNYAISESEQNKISAEEKALIELTFQNTLKNQKISKIKEEKKISRPNVKRVSFVC